MARTPYEHTDGQAGAVSGTIAEIIQAGDQDHIDLPGGFVRTAELSRDGQDLVLEGPDGTAIIIKDYFNADPAPLLQGPEGEALTPDLVQSFVRYDGPLQYADARGGSMSDESPVGAIQEISGQATIIHPDGSSETVRIGTPVYQGDIIETDTEGAVNILFVDETTLAISQNAKLAIDEYVFDPASESGTSDFSILRGLFVFTSGLIGRDDPDDVQIDTPMGSIGIRGTIIAGNLDTGEITVLEGAIVLRAFDGSELTLARQFETARFDPAGGEISYMGQSAPETFVQDFETLKPVMPSLFSGLNGESEDGSAGNAQDIQNLQEPQNDGNDDGDANPANETGNETQNETSLQESVTFANTTFGGDDSGFDAGAGITTDISTTDSTAIQINTATAGTDTSLTTENTATRITTTSNNNIVIPAIQISVDTGALSLAASGEWAISNSMLRADGYAGTDPAQIVYTVTQAPQWGNLLLNSTLITDGDQFTQANINNGLLTYAPSAAAGHTGVIPFDFMVTNNDTGDSLSGRFRVVLGDTGVSNINMASNDIAYGSSTATTFYIADDNNTAFAGAGSGTFNIEGDNNLAVGASGTDLFILKAGTLGNEIHGGGGNDTAILQTATFTYIDGGAGNNRLEIYADGVEINMGANTDNISEIYVSLTNLADETVIVRDFFGTINIGGVNPGTSGGANISHVHVDNSPNSHTFNITGWNYQVHGGAGADLINIDGEGNWVFGGGGADAIYVNGDNNDVNAETGNDTIHIYGANSTVYGGDGTNLYKLFSSSFTQINGGSIGNDILEIYTAVDIGIGKTTQIENIDIKVSNETGMTRIGDTGFTGNVFVYGSNNSNIIIDSSATNISVYGDNNILSGNGTFIIDGTGNDIIGSSGVDSFNVNASGNIIDGSGGDDEIFLRTNGVTGSVFDGGAGYDRFLVDGSLAGVVDFRNVAALSRFEKIDMEGSGQTIILDLTDIIQLATNSSDGSLTLDSLNPAGTNNVLQIDIAGTGSGAVSAADLASEASWTLNNGGAAITTAPNVDSGNAYWFTTGGGQQIYIEQALFTENQVQTI